MFTARKKILKRKGQQTSEIEDNIAQGLFDLEANAEAGFKQDLKDLYITSAKEISVGKEAAIIITVPFKLLKNFRKVQERVVRELEKKNSGKDIVVIAQRRILQKPSRNNRIKHQKRPVSRTQTAVHAAYLEDIVWPTEIVGRRTRYRLDGSKLIKIQLDGKQRANAESKLETFSTVYKTLTGKEVVFDFQDDTVQN